MLIVVVRVAFITLNQIGSAPVNLYYLMLVLMAYPSFLLGRAILKRYYVPELVLMYNERVIFRIVEWLRNRPVVETTRNRINNIKISYPIVLLFGAR